MENEEEKGITDYLWIIFLVIFFPLGIFVYLMMKIENLGEEIEQQEEKFKEE